MWAFIYLVKFIYLASANKQCSLILSDFAHHIEKCSSGMEGEGEREKQFVRKLKKSEWMKEKKTHESLSFLRDVTLSFCAAVLSGYMCSLIYIDMELL